MIIQIMLAGGQLNVASNLVLSNEAKRENDELTGKGVDIDAPAGVEEPDAPIF